MFQKRLRPPSPKFFLQPFSSFVPVSFTPKIFAGMHPFISSSQCIKKKDIHPPTTNSVLHLGLWFVALLGLGETQLFLVNPSKLWTGWEAESRALSISQVSRAGCGEGRRVGNCCRKRSLNEDPALKKITSGLGSKAWGLVHLFTKQRD